MELQIKKGHNFNTILGKPTWEKYILTQNRFKRCICNFCKTVTPLKICIMIFFNEFTKNAKFDYVLYL